MFLRIELYVVLILISLIILRAYIREHRTVNRDFLLAGMALIFMDIFEIISIFFPFSPYFFMHSIVVCLELVLWIYLPYVCLRIIIWRFLGEEILKDSTVRNLMLLPIFITTMMAVVSPFKYYLFKLNLFGEPIAGDYFYVLDIFVGLYTTAAFAVCVFCAVKEHSVDMRVKLFIAGALALLLGGIQFGFGYFMSNFYIVAATLAVLFLYVDAQENRIFVDTLTGLNNRNRFRMYLSNAMNNYLKVNMYLTYVDIDDFKKINDEYGHIVGDLSLRTVAESMLDLNSKFHYFIARLGGDEFAIISSHTDSSDVDVMIEDIRRTLKEKAEKNLPDISLNLSFGTTPLNQAGKTMNDIIRIADNIMYEQKRENKLKHAEADKAGSE